MAPVADRRRESYYEAGVTPGNEFVDAFCNGRFLRTCIKADRVAGWAECYALNAEGDVSIDGLGRARKITVFGQIELRRS